MRRYTLLYASAALFFVLLIAARAYANDDGGEATCDGGDGAACLPSDGGIVDDGGTCRAVGGRCLSVDSGTECGELLSGLPCRTGTMCCVIASVNADGSAVFDSAVCVAVGSACVAGDVCCQGASCAEYGADRGFVCGYPSIDAGARAEAGTSARAASSSGGCSCTAGAGNRASSARWSFAAALLFLVNRQRRRLAKASPRVG
jgi:hypothetical protein